MEKPIRTIGALIALVAVVLILVRWPTNGWGSLVWLGSMVLMTAIRVPFENRTRQNTVTKKEKISLEQVLLVLVAVGGTLLPIIHLATGFFEFANYDLPSWAPYVGLVLLVPGYWLFWRSHADLGLNWSPRVEVREGHELVTSGIYARIRHPMYAAIWLIFLAHVFFLQNWIAGFGGVVAFGLMYFIRVPYEEAMMRAQFGDAYDAYCKRAGRLWPKQTDR